jgi:hypothetical protein
MTSEAVNSSSTDGQGPATPLRENTPPPLYQTAELAPGRQAVNGDFGALIQALATSQAQLNVAVAQLTAALANTTPVAGQIDQDGRLARPADQRADIGQTGRQQQEIPEFGEDAFLKKLSPEDANLTEKALTRNQPLPPRERGRLWETYISILDALKKENMLADDPVTEQNMEKIGALEDKLLLLTRL